MNKMEYWTLVKLLAKYHDEMPFGTDAWYNVRDIRDHILSDARRELQKYAKEIENA